MILKGIVEEDFTNYKLPVMQLIFPKCSFKCGKGLCQNSPIASTPDIEYNTLEIVQKYMSNQITHGVLCAGFEPFDTWDDLKGFIEEFRYWCDDPIIIFTGYEKIEIKNTVFEWLYNYPNIIIKYGRFIPNQQPHYDEILGIRLASDNQRAERIS